MTEPGADMPPNLQALLADSDISVTYVADVGPLARLRDLAVYLDDLDFAVRLGQQWGIVLYAAWSGNLKFAELEPAERELVREYGGTLRRDRLRTLARRSGHLQEIHVPVRLGSRVQPHRVTYMNPIEVVLTGSGFVIAGVIYVLRMIRDWSSSQRAAGAAADHAQAVSDEARAQASQAWTQAHLLRWFADEAKAGRWHIPPGELLGLGPDSRIETLYRLDRLAQNEITLQVPEGLDPGPNSGMLGQDSGS